MAGWVEGIILRHVYYKHFCTEGLLSYMVKSNWVVVVVELVFGLLFGNQTFNSGLQALDLGLWTQACQFQSQIPVPVTGQFNIKRSKNIENLLDEHVGLPQVVIVTVHLVTWSGWTEGRG